MLRKWNVGPCIASVKIISYLLSGRALNFVDEVIMYIFPGSERVVSLD